MRKVGVASLLASITVVVLSCGKSLKVDDKNNEGNGPKYTISGTITYDWVPAKDNITEGGIRLDYTAKTAKPARRIYVVAVRNGVEISATLSNDLGQFNLEVPQGSSVTLRAKAHSIVTGYQPDGIGNDVCSGASWDLRVVDNVTGNSASNSNPSLRPIYVSDGTTVYTGAQTGVTLHVPLTLTGSDYVSRAAAPFAILDTVLTQVELVCQGNTAVQLETLYINWSKDNQPTGSQFHLGQIGTSFFRRQSGINELYILGQEDVDTDEYDDHIVAHEFGHYIEGTNFRSDSLGGSHSGTQTLDPRVAFGEGYGNAFAAMTFNDPVYVDTSGSNQASGFVINVATAPTGDDVGYYSETFVQNFLWKLYDNRDGTANSGLFDRIYNILRNYQRFTVGFTSVLNFVSSYKAVYGDTADGLRTLWETTLSQPWNALCVGACTGTGDQQDLFDFDNDFGTTYAAASRKYPQATGSVMGAEFWRVYKQLNIGANAATAHDVINKGGYSYWFNKLGNSRWYRFKQTSTGARTFTVNSVVGGACTSDTIDMYLYYQGNIVAYDEAGSGATAGCPSISVSSLAAGDYVLEIIGIDTTALTSFAIQVN